MHVAAECTNIPRKLGVFCWIVHPIRLCQPRDGHFVWATPRGPRHSSSRRLMEKYFQSIFIFTHRLAPESRKPTARYRHLQTNCSAGKPKVHIPRQFGNGNSGATGIRVLTRLLCCYCIAMWGEREWIDNRTTANGRSTKRNQAVANNEKEEPS